MESKSMENDTHRIACNIKHIKNCKAIIDSHINVIVETHKIQNKIEMSKR